MPEGEGQAENAQEGGREEVATLPKAILAGKDFKVGDEVVLKITAMHDSEISVEYAPEKKKSTMRDTDGELAAMMDE